MNFLYTITIYPLEILFRFAYLSCVSITGSYGVGLIALSLLVACVYVPLHRVVNKARDREQEVQDILAPCLAKIKENYTGAERHEQTIALYRRYGYHPIMAIRSAFGILLQVPFLMAAYYMVAELSVLNGQSFLFIKDLAKPDALLFGMNLLPVIMTLINVVTTFLTPNMKLKERVQALVLAGLFLWLLYPAPSALLFYWTCNNTIYLLEALFAICRSKKEKNVAKKANRISLVTKIKNFWKSSFANDKLFTLDATKVAKIRHITSTIIFVLLVVFFLLTSKMFYEATSKHTIEKTIQAFEDAYMYFYQMLVIFSLFTSVILVRWLLLTSKAREKTNKEMAEYLLHIVCGVLFYIVTMEILLVKYRKDSILPKLGDTRFLLSFFLPFAYCGWLTILAISHKYYDRFFASVFAKNSGKLYFASTISFTSVFFIYCPATLYISDKEFFRQSFSMLMLTLLPDMFMFLAIMALLYFVLPKKTRVVLSFTTIAIFTFSLLVCFVFTVDYGALDVTILQNANAFRSPITLFKDLLAILVTATFLFFLLQREKVQKFGLAVFLTLTFVTASYSGFLGVSSSRRTDLKNTNLGDDLLPPYHNQLWRLSKTEKNVVVFFFDMFTGGHIKDIVEEEPEMANKLDGFVWYPDTLAIGQCTVISTPSLYGGSFFSPAALDKDKDDESLLSKMNRGYYLLSNEFERHGYDVTIGGLPYSDEEECKKHSITTEALILFSDSDIWGRDYINYWNRKMQDKILKRSIAKRDIKQIWQRYFVVMSIFRVLPHTFRATFYEHGNWQGTLKDMYSQQADWIIPNLAPLQFMADFVTVDAKKPTFKFYESLLSHVPWHLKQDSLVPVDDPYPETIPGTGNMDCGFTLVNGRIPEHFFTEQHMMCFVVAYCEKLKELGCYDNTRIIIVSDHCEGDSAMLNAAFTGDINTPGSPGRPHGLMLVKDFNSRGVMKTDWSLVSSMDTPSFVLSDLFEVQGIPNKTKFAEIMSNKKRIRRHYNVRNVRPEGQNPTNFIYDSIYEVTGTMFKKENWKRIK